MIMKPNEDCEVCGYAYFMTDVWPAHCPHGEGPIYIWFEDLTPVAFDPVKHGRKHAAIHD
jgi:hypothetical protein